MHPKRSRRGPPNDLHMAAFLGDSQDIVDLLSSGSIDIDQGDPKGFTPLMMAAMNGRHGAMKVLLNRGANVSVGTDNGLTALHLTAIRGNLPETLELVKAKADLEAVSSENSATPLHLAAIHDRSEVMTVLIEAGAQVDSRSVDEEGGETALFSAANRGHIAAVRVLLRANANPLLTKIDPSGLKLVPLDTAAIQGHSEVVRELIQQVGIEGCGGESGGVYALQGAAGHQYFDVLRMLVDAGVVDTGIALAAAIYHRHEEVVKFLLQQHEKVKTAGGVSYVDDTEHEIFFRTPLICVIEFLQSPRMARLLVDAGADTTSAVRVVDTDDRVVFISTPLDLTTRCLDTKMVDGRTATEEELNKLEAIRRLLLRAEAVHAVSWLWSRGLPLIGGTAAEDPRRETTTSTPGMQLRRTLPVLRQWNKRGAVLSATLFRYSGKP